MTGFYPEAAMGHGVRQQVGAPAAPTCTILNIPVPPSVNGMFANKAARGGKPGGRFKTKEYKNWIAEAGWSIREQMTAEGCDPVPGRVLVVIGVERKSLQADIDNRCKAVLDLLVTQKVIEDDRWVTGIALSWMPQGTRRTGLCRIAIMPAVPTSITFHPSPDGATGGWFIEATQDDTEV